MLLLQAKAFSSLQMIVTSPTNSNRKLKVVELPLDEDSSNLKAGLQAHKSSPTGAQDEPLASVAVPCAHSQNSKSAATSAAS